MRIEGKEGVMRASATALFLAASLTAACTMDASVGNDPEWLATLIRELENQPVANPPAFIARYDYRGQVVYYLPARCCDIPSNVYNADGAIVCHPDGGFSGSGDGRCSDFFAQRTNEKIVWQDPRGAA